MSSKISKLAFAAVLVSQLFTTRNVLAEPMFASSGGGAPSRAAAPRATGERPDTAGFGRRSYGRGGGSFTGGGSAGLYGSEAVYLRYLSELDDYEWRLYRWQLAKADAAYRAQQAELNRQLAEERRIARQKRKEEVRRARLDRSKQSTAHPSRASWLFGRRVTHSEEPKPSDTAKSEREESANKESKSRERPSILRAFKRALFGA